MKFVLIALFLTSTAYAQLVAVPFATACGVETPNYTVKLDSTFHALAPPEAGKARIYFFNDDRSTDSFATATVYIGMDGAWVGANRGDSYFSLTLDPGVHHLCAGAVTAAGGPMPEMTHFTAEPGKVYYYRTRFVLDSHGQNHIDFMELTPIDIDEAQYMNYMDSLAVSKPRRSGKK